MLPGKITDIRNTCLASEMKGNPQINEVGVKCYVRKLDIYEFKIRLPMVEFILNKKRDVFRKEQLCSRERFDTNAEVRVGFIALTLIKLRD